MAGTTKVPPPLEQNPANATSLKATQMAENYSSVTQPSLAFFTFLMYLNNVPLLAL